ncbi:disease resistance protein 2 [Populus alba x Populus x berolinensis]|nr:disease resistance protein 2 [Populus alba x Populus x berolinensis]
MEEIVVPEGIGEGKMLFPKLLILELTDLPKLTRFCTSNLLECQSLKVLTLEKCPELKEFISVPLSADVPDDTKSALFDDKVKFPELEVFLSFDMDSLKVIWHNELLSDSFCKLKILHVGHGKNLLNIFPSSILGRFHNLENLIINDCDSVEEIFDLQVLINVEQRLAVTATQLRVVRLWNLPHLKHVWNRDPQGILSFDNLGTVHVRGCPGLRSLFPAPVALNLLQLNGVKSILNDLDGEGFPQLKHLHVQNCPGVQYIINSNRMGPRTAFLNLDSLLLENLDNLEKICHGQLMAESLGNLRILKVERCHGLKNLFSVSMARRLVRLEEITIIDCKIMEEVVVAEESESDAADGEPIEFTQLRRLTLQCLPQFTSFHSNVEESSVSQRRQKLLLAGEARSKEIVAGNELGTSMSLFNTKVLFPNLEDLKLSSIKVEKIWHDQPAVQPPCVKNLASIAVESCSNLNYLLTSSMVESLAQLKSLEIQNCESMEEIVVPVGIGEGIIMSKMLFPKLLILSLIRLPKLTRFCTSNLLECHSLKVLTVGNCPELKEFISIPSSADVPVMSKPDNTKSALFDDKVAFPDLEEFLIAEMDNLKVIWHRELHPDSFCKLKTLHVVAVKNLLNIFPSSMLGRFHSLESLTIAACDSVEEIFDLQTLINVEQRLAVTATQLRVVRLTNLPKLKHVWNRDPQGILSFHNLCTVHVRGCLGLRSLFPASIALNLLQLEELLIENCGVEEIIAKDEGLEEGPEFLFPKVTYLHLVEVPELKRFYPGIHTSEWPRLKKFWVYHCKKIEIFPSEIKCSHEP